VTLGRPEDIAPDVIIHRVGGGGVANLRLSPLDQRLTPPGISVLLGGTPQEAATQMLQAFPGSKKWQAAAKIVGTTIASAVRQTGFEVIPDPTGRFLNHARLVHPQGTAGFDDANLMMLSQVFHDTTGF
jgi:hypothetical protein